MIISTKEITFKRDTLYEEVWSKPMRVLAKHYGLSDNGLRKVCAALAIPLPKQGHWAKAAAGHKVPKAPLPPHDGRTVFISRPPASAPFGNEQVAERAAALQNSMARQRQHMVLVFDPAARLHRVLVPIDQKLRESAKEYEKSREAFLNPPKRPRWDNPVVRLANHYEYWLKDGFELCHRTRGLPFRVTPPTWQRALTIVNTIVLYAETLKMNVESVDKPPRIVIKPVTSLSTSVLRSTSRLRLFLSYEGWSSPKCIADSSKEPLESKSETILSAIDRQLALPGLQISNGRTVIDDGRRIRKERRRSENCRSASGSASRMSRIVGMRLKRKLPTGVAPRSFVNMQPCSRASYRLAPARPPHAALASQTSFAVPLTSSTPRRSGWSPSIPCLSLKVFEGS